MDESNTWAIHWFEPKLLLLNLKVEHILLVVISMSRCLPQVKIVDIWCHNLLVFMLPVFLLDVLHCKDQDLTKQMRHRNEGLYLGFQIC